MHGRWLIDDCYDIKEQILHVVTLLTRVHRTQLAYPTNTLIHKSILRRVRGRLPKQFPMNVEETNSSLPSTRNSLRGIFTPSRAPMQAIALMGGRFTNLSLIKSLPKLKRVLLEMCLCSFFRIGLLIFSMNSCINSRVSVNLELGYLQMRPSTVQEEIWKEKVLLTTLLRILSF